MINMTTLYLFVTIKNVGNTRKDIEPFILIANKQRTWPCDIRYYFIDFGFARFAIFFANHPTYLPKSDMSFPKKQGPSI